MRNFAIKFFAVSLFIGTLPTAQAKVLGGEPSKQAIVPPGMPVLAPLAFVDFCRKNPDDCAPRRTEQKAVVDNERKLLQDVNGVMNARIVPDQKGVRLLPQRWSFSARSGSCNDYAVTKRHVLIALGFDPKRLLLAQVLTRSGEAHMVLLVRMIEGDVVLDNLTASIELWSAKPYFWVKRQSELDPALWVTVAVRS